MNDLISRQAAIDALHTWFRDGFDEDRWWNSTHVLAAIEGLPSAQPEIVQCKDCTMFDKKRGCNLVEGLNIAKPDSFCSYAERRKG